LPKAFVTVLLIIKVKTILLLNLIYRSWGNLYTAGGH